MSRLKPRDANKDASGKFDYYAGWPDETTAVDEEELGVFDDVLDSEDDFVADDDVAFLGEDYDVLELEEVLELCNMPLRARLAG